MSEGRKKEQRKCKNESKKVRKKTVEPNHFTKKTRRVKKRNLKSLLQRCNPSKPLSNLKICNVKSIRCTNLEKSD